MSNNAFNTSKPQSWGQIRKPQNFVEALKSVGGYQKTPLTPYSNEAFPQSPENHGGYSRFEQQEALRQQELRRKRHFEITSTPLYDRHQEEIRKQIEALRMELRALVKELASLGSSVQKAIDEEIASPGKYHVSYFEKLRLFIVNLRKRVSESNSWMAISAQRKAARNVYWGNVKKSGTKFMLSSERTLATQTG
jgi:hypothetical protein